MMICFPGRAFSRLSVLLVLLLSLGCQQSPVNSKPTVDRDKLAKINTELGFQYLQKGEYEVALRKLEKALDADRNYVDAHNAMGVLHSRLGQFEDAERSFSQALRLDDKNSAALNNFGQFLCQRQRHEEGEKQFLKAVENPLYKYPAVAYSNAGSCAFDAGALDRAEEHFRAALKLEPNIEPTLLQMADLSFQRERFLAARGYLQRYEALAPHNARSLWLGVRIETELEDRDAVSSYALQLEKNFPDAIETKQLYESRGR